MEGSLQDEFVISDVLLFRLIQSAKKVHRNLGPGFVESIYSRALVTELRSEGLNVEREKLIRVCYENVLVGKHWLDLVINDAVILELKANRGFIPAHAIQLRSYLHASSYPDGLIINFGMPDLQWEHVASPDENEG